MTEGKTTKRKRLSFLDRFHREIVPEHVRAALSGDVFLGFDVEQDLPPQGATVELLVRAKVGGATLKPTKEGPYVVSVSLKGEGVRDLVVIVPESESTDQVTVDDLLPESAESVTISHPASGTSTTIRRGEEDGTRRSAAAAKRRARAGRTPGRRGGRGV